MVILITGASHTGKTILAQRLLEKYKYPYLSIDHLKMGLIRSGMTALTPEDDDALTDELWPIVREMVKTAIENHQNLAERYFHSTSPVLIVYLADKMFCGDECVGIEERFRRKRDKHKGDEKAMKKLAYKEKQALRAKEVYENSILGWPVG